jgi:hypothetical protein
MNNIVATHRDACFGSLFTSIEDEHFGTLAMMASIVRQAAFYHH